MFQKIILLILFNSTTLTSIITTLIYIAGLWLLLRKCGSKGWYALIPCYRDYALARCVDREMEGRVVFITGQIYILINIALLFVTRGLPHSLLQGLSYVIPLINLIYSYRVLLGLTEMFGRRRDWALIWLLFDFIAAPFWALSRDFQPRWMMQDLKNDPSQFFSGSHASVNDKGLTINLEERTVAEFFRKKYLLRDIHISIQPGHMVLLLGGSGAGKTTLVNAVNGYEKAKAEIILNGSDVYQEYKSMQYKIGYVPQQDLMRGSDTVLHTLLDNACLRLPASFTGAERRARVDEVMAIFGLTPVKDNQVDKLSGGQRKRLSIAMEFLSNPSLFILDEPDSGLDGVMARELMEQLRSIADQGKIVIVITHTPDRVIDLFDDVIVLAKDSNRIGRLACYGTTEETKAFFGRDSMEQIIRCINRTEEGGEGLADQYIRKYTEVQHG